MRDSPCFCWQMTKEHFKNAEIAAEPHSTGTPPLIHTNQTHTSIQLSVCVHTRQDLEPACPLAMIAEEIYVGVVWKLCITALFKL